MPDMRVNNNKNSSCRSWDACLPKMPEVTFEGKITDMTIFFYGPNTYELRKHLKDMTSAYIAKAGSDFGLERVNGESVRAQELTAILGASPFLANSRLVIV